MIPSGARCGAHAEVAAVDVCQRCGRFLCGDCVELLDEEVYCAECAARVNLPPSLLAKAAPAAAGFAWLAFAAATLGLRGPLSFFVLVVVPAPTARAALAMALVEWRRIKASASPARGRRWLVATFVAAGPLLLLLLALFAWGLRALLANG